MTGIAADPGFQSAGQRLAAAPPLNKETAMLEIKDLQVRFLVPPENMRWTAMCRFIWTTGKFWDLLESSLERGNGNGHQRTAARRKTEAAGSILLDGQEMLNVIKEGAQRFGKDLGVVFKEPMTSLDRWDAHRAHRWRRTCCASTPA